jgi:hypothetical protein
MIRDRVSSSGEELPFPASDIVIPTQAGIHLHIQHLGFTPGDGFPLSLE